MRDLRESKQFIGIIQIITQRQDHHTKARSSHIDANHYRKQNVYNYPLKTALKHEPKMLYLFILCVRIQCLINTRHTHPVYRTENAASIYTVREDTMSNQHKTHPPMTSTMITIYPLAKGQSFTMQKQKNRRFNLI
eukprot:272428_1